MSLQQSSTSAVEHSGARNESKTRLHGRGLFIARAGWVALTLLVLVLNAIAIPHANVLLQAVCQPGALCINGWTPAEASQIQQFRTSRSMIGLASTTRRRRSRVPSTTIASRVGSWISTICHGRPVRRSLCAPSMTPRSDVTLCGSFVPQPYPVGST